MKSLWSLGFGILRRPTTYIRVGVRNLARCNLKAAIADNGPGCRPLALGKIANAESARARQRPSGLTGLTFSEKVAGGVALIHRATSGAPPGPHQSRVLPANFL